MKKRLTILLMGFLVLGNSFAQETPKIEYQFDLGTTLSLPYKSKIETWPNVANSPVTNYNSSFGYFLEVMASYNISYKIAINSGINFSHNAIKIDDKIGVIEYKGKMLNSYLQIPVMCTYKFSGKTPFSISVGPYIGLLLNSKEKGTQYIDPIPLPSGGSDPLMNTDLIVQDYNYSTTDNYKSIDLGLSMQVNYQFRLNSNYKGLFLTRFNYGLTNTRENSSYDWKNYNFMIGFGIIK
jgi:hypothetical protein